MSYSSVRKLSCTHWYIGEFILKSSSHTFLCFSCLKSSLQLWRNCPALQKWYSCIIWHCPLLAFDSKTNFLVWFMSKEEILLCLALYLKLNILLNVLMSDGLMEWRLFCGSNKLNMFEGFIYQYKFSSYFSFISKIGIWCDFLFLKYLTFIYTLQFS